jgi:CheY-like chemotaxis protein
MDDKKPSILVTDDDPEIRHLLASQLEAAGMQVTQAENGQDAIDKCRQNPPDLIVIDVRMPVMSGTEAVSVIKEDPKLRDIKIVFLSNFGEDDEINAWVDQKYAQEMGAMDYIKKNEDLDRIIAKIRVLLAR